MKTNQLILLCAFALLLHTSARGQAAATHNRYIDYQQFFSHLHLDTLSGKATVSLKILHDSAALLADEAAPKGEEIKTLRASRKSLDGASIYALRKQSVFIIGKLSKAQPSGTTNFDLIGTAFAISANGVCVTNYHVLKDILQKPTIANNNDSLYFIINTDGQVHFIDNILAYSQNNDIAVFHINTRGMSLVPLPLGRPAEVGDPVYCLSHPLGFFYYFSNGMVARNVTIDKQAAAAGYNPLGRPPIRMEITTDYAIGSSGGPILDQCGNLVGIVSSTAPISTDQGKGAIMAGVHQQMVVKDTAPVAALLELLGR
ncbi:trypsin-like peptidase [Chitinophaga polysaccharea]|uniref:Trypsin-like peptidase n=1 Tax=Chitinophaga polysaccharea TaxID=1293035 RepID=A0A561PXU3_9BACT|nr:trypsin-like peptidase domain-containing protein [Chitinophaga polysaccharea]TWF42941.1 trypsin-like peptidase [Chitinophaga polysaccharea]